jgi:hypothetical protein
LLVDVAELVDGANRPQDAAHLVRIVAEGHEVTW